MVGVVGGLPQQVAISEGLLGIHDCLHRLTGLMGIWSGLLVAIIVPGFGELL